MDPLARLQRTMDYLLSLAGAAKDGTTPTSAGSLYAALSDLAAVYDLLRAALPPSQQPKQTTQPKQEHPANPFGAMGEAFEQMQQEFQSTLKQMQNALQQVQQQVKAPAQ